MIMRAALPFIALVLATPLLAQMPKEMPGKLDAKRVTAGSYAVDTDHTLVAWTVNHLGFNDYFGLFGGITGTMTLDPAKPGGTSVSIDIPMSGLTTTNPKLNGHLSSPDFLNVAQFATAKFVSTSVVAKGNAATINGNLTLHGVTKPVVMSARFTGAGNGMVSKKPTVGFQATTAIKRSDFGMGAFVPFVSDRVDLKITAAFEKQ
jgi:polyisoprenoid-binding protein YceI